METEVYIMLKFAPGMERSVRRMTNDKELTKKLRERFELLFHLEKDLLPPPIHVDQNMFGCLPLKLYRMTKDERYKELGLPYADTQWILPEKANDEERKWHKKGYSWQTRLWIDDMYMITIVQAEAYHVTGDKIHQPRCQGNGALSG